LASLDVLPFQPLASLQDHWSTRIAILPEIVNQFRRRYYRADLKNRLSLERANLRQRQAAADKTGRGSGLRRVLTARDEVFVNQDFDLIRELR